MRQNNGEKKFSFNILDALIIVMIVFLIAFTVYVFILGRGISHGESAFVTISKVTKYLRIR